MPAWRVRWIAAVAALVVVVTGAVFGNGWVLSSFIEHRYNTAGNPVYGNVGYQLLLHASYLTDYGKNAYFSAPAQWPGLVVALVLLAVLTFAGVRFVVGYFAGLADRRGTAVMCLVAVWSVVVVAATVAGFVRSLIAFDPLYASGRWTGAIDDGLLVGPPTGLLTGWITAVVTVALLRRSLKPRSAAALSARDDAAPSSAGGGELGGGRGVH